MKDLISVIVPVYNIAAYLDKCVKSLLAQTFENIEIILVDDGSTDGSGELCDGLKKTDKRIKVFHKENGGVSSARNMGLMNASGNLIGFCDGDDYVEPNMYKTLYDNMQDANADISHCAFQYVKKDKTIPFYGTGKKEILDRTKGVCEIIYGNYIEPSLCTKLYKRSVVESISFDSEIKFNEDLLFNVRAFLNCEKSVFEDIVLYNYVSRENSAAVNAVWGEFSKKAFLDSLEVGKRVWDLTKCENREIRLAGLTSYIGRLTNAIITTKKEKTVKPLKNKLYTKLNILKNDKDFTNLSKRLRYKVKLVRLPYPIYRVIHGSVAKENRWES